MKGFYLCRTFGFYLKQLKKTNRERKQKIFLQQRRENKKKVAPTLLNYNPIPGPLHNNNKDLLYK